MKKLRKLFAMLFAVLGVGTLSAQTWTESKVSAGTYYLYNVGAEKYLCSGNNYGSHASVTEGGIPLTLAGSGNVYTISTDAIYSGKFLGTDAYMDKATALDWTFEEVSIGVYKIKNGDNVLYWNGGTSTNTTLGADPGTAASQWKLVTEENRVAALSDATQGTPIDATFLIKNAYFAKGDGHYFVRTGSYNSLATSTSWKGTDMTDFWGNDTSGEDACYAVEQYNKTFDNYQELTVPNGKYFLTAKGFYRGNVVPYIYANDQKCNLKVKGDIGGDNIGNGAIALMGDDYLLDGLTVVVTNGTLRVGVKSDTNVEWCVFDDFKLVYYGLDLSIYESTLSNIIATAQGLELNSAIKSTLDQAVANAQKALNDANRTVESLETAIAELESVVSSANSTVSIYAKLNALVATCNSYVENSTPANAADLTNFNEATTKAAADKETAETADALNDIYNTLESARQTYVVKAIPTNDITFDLTFKVVNPTFDTGVTGWKNAAMATNQGNAITPPYGERWAGNSYVGTIEQTITELPIGIYIVKAASFRDQLITDATDKDAVYLFGNDAETLVSSAIPAMYTVENVLTYDGNMTLGVKSKVANYKWMGIDNVSLLYAGKNLAFCKEALQQAITKAEAVDEATLNTAVKAILAQAITDANTAKEDANATIVSVEKATSDLIEKVNFANNTTKIYARINTTLSICDGYAANSNPATSEDLTEFNAVITKTKADKETAATVDALNNVFNTLESARQTYVVKAYPIGNTTFDMTFKIVNPTFDGNTNGWTVNTGKWHNNNGYDGVSGIAEIANWGANSWTASITQNISLPNGKYKVKVAAQASKDNTELKLVANEETESLTCIGDNGGNIASDGSVVELGSGVAGWQYIEVECLVDNGTLSIAANSSATAQHCWANVDNFTLTLLRDLTDDEKIAISQKELKSTLDAANALNTTVNIGEGMFEIPASAVAALKNAISTAQSIYDNVNATIANLETANTDLSVAIDTYKDIELKGPSADERFYITIATPGHGRLGCPVIATSGSASTNNPTGYTFYATGSYENYRPTVFTLTKVNGNSYNISVELEEGTVYLTYGSLNGSPASWNKSQIQGTTDVNAKGTFKIEASSVVDGGIRIVNTETGNYLDCENNATKNYPIYSGSHSTYEFALVDASKVTTSIKIDANVQLATCVLLFDAELPANLKAYTTGTLENGYLNLVEVNELKAYKPYILYAENGYEGELSGKVDLAGYQPKVSDENGLLAGAVETQVITYGYALQNQTGENGKGVAFYSVDTENSQKVTIPAGKCWLDVQKNSAPNVTTRSISLRFPEGGATGIGDVKIELPADGSEPIYTIDGKRVEVMQSGQIYIIGGKKVIKK